MRQSRVRARQAGRLPTSPVDGTVGPQPLRGGRAGGWREPLSSPLAEGLRLSVRRFGEPVRSGAGQRLHSE
jgi:hypothetical protein